MDDGATEIYDDTYTVLTHKVDFITFWLNGS